MKILKNNFSHGSWFCWLFASQYRYQLDLGEWFGRNVSWKLSATSGPRGICDITWHLAPKWRYSGDFRASIPPGCVVCQVPKKVHQIYETSRGLPHFPGWFGASISFLCENPKCKRLLKHGLLPHQYIFHLRFLDFFWIWKHSGLGSRFPGRLLRGTTWESGWIVVGWILAKTDFRKKCSESVSSWRSFSLWNSIVQPDQFVIRSHKIEVGMTEIDEKNLGFRLHVHWSKTAKVIEEFIARFFAVIWT